MDWVDIGHKCINNAFKVLHGARINVLDGKTADAHASINVHTTADLDSQDAILKILKEEGIACCVVAEQDNGEIFLNGGGETQVIIDPIDNSVLFARGEISFCAVGMFVLEDNFPVCSFVGDIATGDIYYCDKNRAYKNRKAITIPLKTIGKPILAGWAPYDPRMKKFYEKFSKLPQREYLMFNYGQMLQAAKITQGCYDACFEILPAKLQEFAGAIIAWRAGGTLTTMEGNPIVWDGNVRQTMLVSRNKELHQKLLTAFNS